MFDFIELAASSRHLIERALGEDDDFAKIENDGGGNDSILTQTASAYGNTYYYTDSTPLLSKTAEAELYLLATNFLLCESIVKFHSLMHCFYVTLDLTFCLVLSHRCRHGDHYNHRRQDLLSRVSPTWQ